jgi:hypothetical protein
VSAKKIVWKRVKLKKGGFLATPESKNPAEAGFCKELKLTDKPRSFENSVVDSHSSSRRPESKNPAEAGFS